MERDGGPSAVRKRGRCARCDRRGGGSLSGLGRSEGASGAGDGTDLGRQAQPDFRRPRRRPRGARLCRGGISAVGRGRDRKSGGEGKGVSVRVDIGGRGIIKNKNTRTITITTR